MKKIWKKWLCLLMVFGIVSGCAGCVGNVPDPTDGSMDPSGVDPTAPPKTTLSQYQDPNATHLYEEVREGFLIDAEVVGAPDDTPRGLYQAELKLISPAQIDAFLAANGDSISSAEETANERYHTYKATCASGSDVFFRKALERDDSDLFQYMNKDKFDCYNNYLIYLGDNYIEEKGHFSTAWMFEEEKELSFASADQAEQEVRQRLALLGLTELTLNRTLYIDHLSMAEAGKWLNEDANTSSFFDDPEFPQKEDWSEADDAYMFSFCIDVEGIPLSLRFETRDTASYLGCEVIVFYTADGIIFLDFSSPWTVGEPEGEPTALITAGEALQTTRATLINVLSYQNLVIDKVSLEYQYRQDGDRWLLFPVWVVRAYYDMDWSDGYNYLYYQYDAVTGEEL